MVVLLWVLLTSALRAMVKETILTFKKLNLSLFTIFQYYIFIFIPLSNAPRTMVSTLLIIFIQKCHKRVFFIENIKTVIFSYIVILIIILSFIYIL